MKYVDLKKSLVSNSYRISKELIATLAAVEMRLLADEEAHSQRMVLAKLVKGASSEIKLFGINQNVYQQFCSMANDE